MPMHMRGHKVLAHVYFNFLGDSQAIRSIFSPPIVVEKDAAPIPVALRTKLGG